MTQWHCLHICTWGINSFGMKSISFGMVRIPKLIKPCLVKYHKTLPILLTHQTRVIPRHIICDAQVSTLNHSCNENSRHNGRVDSLGVCHKAGSHDSGSVAEFFVFIMFVFISLQEWLSVETCASHIICRGMTRVWCVSNIGNVLWCTTCKQKSIVKKFVWQEDGPPPSPLASGVLCFSMCLSTMVNPALSTAFINVLFWRQQA
jgi:hypothetical protein